VALDFYPDGLLCVPPKIDVTSPSMNRNLNVKDIISSKDSLERFVMLQCIGALTMACCQWLLKAKTDNQLHAESTIPL
jgi:hypothetical protein